MASSTRIWKQVSGLMTSHRARRIVTVETKCKVRHTKLYCNHGNTWQAYYVKEMQHSRCYLSNGRNESSLWSTILNVEHENHEWTEAHNSWMNWGSQQLKNCTGSIKSVMCKRCAGPADGANRPELSLWAVIIVRRYATDRPTDRLTVTSSRDSVVWNRQNNSSAQDIATPVVPWGRFCS